MNKIITWIKQNRTFIFIVLALAILAFIIGISFIINRTTPPEPDQGNTDQSDIDQNQITYQDTILPGTTQLDQLTDKLGEPERTAEWEGYTILNYSTNSNWDNQFFISKEKKTVALITQQVENNQEITQTSLIRQYGTPEIILYGPLSPARNLYSYPSRGFAFLGSDFHESVLQLWYFQPTDTANFVETIARKFGYSSSPPKEEPEFFPNVER